MMGFYSPFGAIPEHAADPAAAPPPPHVRLHRHRARICLVAAAMSLLMILIRFAHMRYGNGLRGAMRTQPAAGARHTTFFDYPF